MIHHACDNDDHMRGTVECLEIFRRIVTRLAKTTRVQKPDQWFRCRRKIVAKGSLGLRLKSVADLGVSRSRQKLDDRRLTAARLSEQPKYGNRNLFEQVFPL